MTDIDTQPIRQLINLVSASFREKMSNLPEKYLGKSEHELMNNLQQELPNWRVSEIDFGLRTQFWDEYAWAQKHGCQMRMTNVYKDVCDPAEFSRITSTPHRLAYITTPFFNDIQKRRRALSVLWKEMTDIITSPIKNDLKTGLPDGKLIANKIDLFKFLYTYEHGLPDQNINTKNLNYNVEATQQIPPTMEDLDEKIRQLEAKTVDITQPEKVIALPVERVVQESGRVTEEFKRK